MAVRPQAPSPVISPRVSTLAGVFSGVKTAARNRLDHTMPNLAAHNRLPNIIAQGRAVQPRATLSNETAAEVLSFRPQPWLQPARHSVLNIHNDPGFQVDQVADALQRYLGVRPRREPTADPRDEASVARHPMGLPQDDARQTDDAFYQFTDNGVEQYQIRPDYRAWGGSLHLEFKNRGLTSVAAPPAVPPRPGAAPVHYAYYDPAHAAQDSQARTTELLSGSAEEPLTVGPPLITQDPYFDPPFAAQNATHKIRTDLANALSGGTRVLVGAPNQTQDPYFDPPFAGQNAMHKIRTDLSGGARVQRGFIENFTRPAPALSDWT